MNAIDLTPFYRNNIGFDRIGSLLNHALQTGSVNDAYPPYNVEVEAENKYAVTLAVAGFSRDELDLQVENGVLTVKGKKAEDKTERKFLHQGIANRSFERKFNLADHVEVTGADMEDGLLVVSLVKNIPEAMKPKSIAINDARKVLEHDKKDSKAA